MRIRILQYCPLFLYLMLFSHAWMLLQTPVAKGFEWIAFTSNVINASFNVNVVDGEHYHSQEVAELSLEQFKKIQEEQREDEKEQNTLELEKKIKIVTPIPAPLANHQTKWADIFKVHSFYQNVWLQTINPPPEV